MLEINKVVILEEVKVELFQKWIPTYGMRKEMIC